MLRSALVAVLLVYLGWNAWWLTVGQFAPSLLLATTSIPSPTTGGTRAIASLWRGDIVKSLQYNAMAIPLCLMLAASIVQLIWQASRKQRVRLETPLVWSWAAILLLAWLGKMFVAEP